MPKAPSTDLRFDKFTDHAMNVLAHAQTEAKAQYRNYIGTEHLLLGLLREDKAIAATILKNLNVDFAKARTAVEFIVGRGALPVTATIGLTPRSKRVVELAIDEAKRLNHHYIGTEHLLLGLVAEGEGIAAGVLEAMGVRLGSVRHEVFRVLTMDPSIGPEVTNA